MTIAAATTVLTTVTTEDINPVTRLGTYAIAVEASATVNYTVSFTLGGGVYFDHAVLADLTVSSSGTIDFPVAGIRLEVNSVTGGSAQLFIVTI